MAYTKVGNRRVATHPKRHTSKKQLTAECRSVNMIWVLAVEELRDRLINELNEDAQIKLGDASIASPFTCKSTGIDKGMFLYDDGLID